MSTLSNSLRISSKYISVLGVLIIYSFISRTYEREPYLVVRIKSCQGTDGLDASLPENPLVTYQGLSTPDIFHLNTIDAVVGRIEVSNNRWAIIDCSRNGARTQFVNDDDDDDDG
jgi:hypothetical protein